MSVPPVRPVTAGEAALRVQVAPDAAQVLRTDAGAAINPTVRPPTPAIVRTPPVQVPPQAAPSLQAVASEALAKAVQGAVTRQTGTAPLLADLFQALQTPDLPEPVRAAATQALAAQPSLGPAATPAQVRQALTGSGLFLEARLAALIPARGEEAARLAAQIAPGADAKAGLLVLKGALAAWLATLPKPETPAHPPHRPTPPPFREGPLQGQPPALPSFTAESPPGTVAQHLSQETTAALARQELMQAASLPDARRDLDGPRWSFEAPVQTPAGDGLAQFEISRDGKGSGAPDAKPVWRARFSLDVEPIGPVHVQVALAAGRTQIALWAERGEGAEHLRLETGALAAAMLAADMPADVQVHQGRPPAPPAPAGAFVERTA